MSANYAHADFVFFLNDKLPVPNIIQNQAIILA